MKWAVLFELTESTLAELKSSKYYNDDLSPTSVSEKLDHLQYHNALGRHVDLYPVLIACIRDLSRMGVSPWLSVLNVALGNVIILIPIQLNSQIGTKYGIPFPLFARLTFGTLGAQIPALLRAITACGWTSVQAWVGGGAVGAMIGAFIPKFADEGWTLGLPSWGGIQESGGGQFFGYVIFMLLYRMGCIQWYRTDQMGTEHRISDPDRRNDRSALLGLLHYSGRNRILRSYGSAKRQRSDRSKRRIRIRISYRSDGQHRILGNDGTEHP